MLRPHDVAKYMTSYEQRRELHALAGMDAIIDSMGRALDLYNRAPTEGLPAGAIHYDMHPDNVIVDEKADVVAVLDFDDAHEAPLIFDPVSLLFPWCRASNGILDRALCANLLSSYNARRPLVAAECQALWPVLVVDRAAQATGYLLGSEPAMLAGHASPTDCGSARELQELLAQQPWTHNDLIA
jgi:Ser/Thr protein kinase RdoA (MazF antagonist)